MTIGANAITRSSERYGSALVEEFTRKRDAQSNDMRTHKRRITSGMIAFLSLFAIPLLAQNPIQVAPLQIIDGRTGAAKACSGCQIFSYLAGTNTPSATYTDYTVATPNTNPVLTNASGYAVAADGTTITGIWPANSRCYKFVLKDDQSVTIWTQDHLCSAQQIIMALLSATSGSSLIGFQQVGGIATTVQAALRNCPFDVQYSSLALAIANIPAYGCLNVVGVWTVGTGITLTASNVTLKGWPGNLIKAGVNSLTMITNTGSGNTIDGLVLDGQFSQGKTGGVALSATAGVGLTVKNNIFQNIGAFGISVNGLTGNFISSYNQFLNIGNGVCCNTNASAGLLIANAGTSAAKPTLIISSHDICDTLTTGGCVKMFQENVAVKTTIIIEDEICHAIGTYCAEGSTVAAISVKITNQHSDQYIASASGGLGAVSWEMGGKIAGVEVPGNDGQILIDGQTADQGSAGTAGHGIVNEIFSPHLQLTNSRSTGAFAEWTKLSGGGIISGNSIKGAWIGIGQNATYDVAPITITANRFSENCTAGVQASAASINVSGNTFLRTPSICSADASTTYVGYQGGANQTGLTGSGIFNNNLFVINSGTIGTFGWTGISRGAAANEYDLFDGNKFLNYNAAAFGAAFADGAGRQMDYATILNSTLTNMLTIGFTAGATHGIRIGNNVDTSGTLASVTGAYIIANQEVPYNSTPNCTAFNRGVTVAVNNSTTTTWGATMASGGAFHATGICNPTIPGFTVISQ